MAKTAEVNILMRLLGGSEAHAGIVKLTASFAGLARSLAAPVFASLSAGTFARMVKGAIDSADAMGKLSEKTGIAVEQLSALTFAAKLSEVTQEDLQIAMKGLSAEMVKQGRGSASLHAELLKIAEEFADMPDGANKTTRAVELFGKSGQRMIPLLNQGSKALREQFTEAKAFGLIIGPEFAANADQFNDNIIRIKAAVQGMFNKFAEGQLPGVNAAMDQFLADVKNSSLQFTILQKLMAQGLPLGPASKAAAEDLIRRAQRQFEKLRGIKPPAELEDARQEPQFTAPVFSTQEETQKTFLKLAKFRMRIIEASDIGEIDRSEMKIELLKEQLGLQQKLLDLHNATTNGMMTGQGGAIDTGTASFLEKGSELLAAHAETNGKILALEKKLSDDTVRIKEEEEKRKKGLRAMAYQAGIDALGNAATAAQAFGAEGFEVAKGFLVAQAIMQTYTAATGANAALSWIPLVGPALGAIAAAAAVAAGLANIAQIVSASPPGGYMAGGYTGPGAVGDVAGVVHRREFVFDEPSVTRIGAPTLEAMRSGQSITGGSGPTNVIIVDNRDTAERTRRDLQNRGLKAEIINMVGKNKRRL